ncbi:MAG: endonuclease III domain-containing protein [Deltaproteobacteria bacterium]|nr:endonuclease III domain-containing protein [Deltaproteobacteria bacterium]
MSAHQRALINIYQTLLTAFGPQNWWPANTPEEVLFGTILAQNTTWRNAESAIDALRSADKLSFRAIYHMDLHELAALVKPARFLNQKAKTLKLFSTFFGNGYGFDLDRLRRVELWTLRERLLNLYRIGPETADSILLYALEKPIFVVDAYTRRLFSSHGFVKQNDSYDSIQKFFMDNLPKDVPMYNEFHALIVRTGADYCKPRPLCHNCPLSSCGNIT